MRSSLTLFAAACAASLALSTSAGAATILAFGQQFSSDFVSATVAGSSTTLNTNGPAGSPTSIPIQITQLGALGGPGLPTTLGFETFLPALTSTASTSGGVQNGFNGTILITTGPGGTGNLFLSATITNGTLNANGMAGGFNASTGTTAGGNPVTVTLTSNNSQVIAAMGGSGATFTTPGAASLTLVGITPAQSGAGFISFTGQNTGNFSTAIPEPASFLSACTAILAGLGCFGWSRRKSSSKA